MCCGGVCVWEVQVCLGGGVGKCKCAEGECKCVGGGGARVFGGLGVDLRKIFLLYMTSVLPVSRLTEQRKYFAGVTERVNLWCNSSAPGRATAEHTM